MAFRCPSCNQPLYNRRRATCGSCGAKIPTHLLLTTEQRQRLDAEREREEKEHRDSMNSNSPPMGYSGGFDVPFF